MTLKHFFGQTEDFLDKYSNECFWLGLSQDNDPEHIANECRCSRMKQFPPLEDYCPVV